MSDAAAPLSKDLSREEIVTALRALKPVFAREGVTHMELVGSRARGDNQANSDIDLAIEVDSERKFSLVEIVRIARAVEDRFGLRADLLMRRSLRPDLLAAVNRDQIRVF